MYDGIQLFFHDAEICDRLRDKLPGLVSHVSEDTGAIIQRSGRYQNFFVQIFENSAGVKIRGSLHKFYSESGNNDTLFSLSDARIAIDNLSKHLWFDQTIPCIQRIELGINLVCKCPEAIIDAAVMYNGRVASRRNIKRESYFKAWEFDDYTIKLYRKGPTILRYEVHIDRLRKISEIPLRTLSDMKNKSIFIMCIQRLLSFGEQFLFVPGKIESLPSELHSIWSSWRDDTYWNGLKPYQKTREKHRVEEAILEYDLIDWKAFLRKGIITQGAAMLNINVLDLVAMISRLGSNTETVAGPQGNCDRRTETKQDVTSKTHDCVSLLLSVRNGSQICTSCTVRVYSDVHIGGRGPPSSLFILSFSYVRIQRRTANACRIKNVIYWYRTRIVEGERLLDGFRVGLGPSTSPSAGASSSKSLHRTLMREVALKLAYSSKYGEQQFTMWSGRVKPAFLKRLDVRTTGTNPVYKFKKVLR